MIAPANEAMIASPRSRPGAAVDVPPRTRNSATALVQRTALVIAGGTGGHVFPGLAVAAALVARGWRVVWMGHPQGMEVGLVGRAGLPFEGVPFGALRGKGVLALVRLPLNFARAWLQARAVLQRVRPQVVLGMGGYVTVPGGTAARSLGIPLILHEQNSVAGLANRLLARFAVGVVEAFPGAFQRPGGGRLGALLGGALTPLRGDRVAVLGNPVRAALADLPAPLVRARARRGPLRILVVGGSLGAKALNELVPAALTQLAGRLPSEWLPRVRHQSGRAHLEALRAAYAKAEIDAEVLDFIDDMAQAYGDADLVICRAGAATVAELAVAGVAALLVPFPFAVDDHQTSNARWLVDAGAAWLAAQSQLSAPALADQLYALARPIAASDAGVSAEIATEIPTESPTEIQTKATTEAPNGRAELAAMAQRARALAYPDAAQRVADFVEARARG